MSGGDENLPTGATTNGETDIINIVIKRPREDNNWNNFECRISKRSTIGELKKLLEQQHPAHPLQQKQQLIYGGRILNDGELIDCIISSSVYQVSNVTKPVLYLVLRGEGSTRAEGNSRVSSPRNYVSGSTATEPSTTQETSQVQSSEQRNAQTTEQTNQTSTGNAVTETLELQRLLQNYFLQLEGSLRDWSRQLEQLANISGNIARGISSSEYSGAQGISGLNHNNEDVHRNGNATNVFQQGNVPVGERNIPHEARGQQVGRHQAETAAPVFQRGFVLQFQVDWQLLMKLIFLVLLLGQDGDPIRFYILLCFAVLVYLYQTGALSGFVSRVGNLLTTPSMNRTSNVSRAATQQESLSERRTSRIFQTIRSIYLKIYIFLYSFICSLFPAWQPDPADRPPQHED